MNNFLSQIGLSDVDLAAIFLAVFPNIVKAALAVVFFVGFYLVTARVMHEALRRTNMQSSLIEVIVRSLYRWAVIIFAVIFVLAQFGINVTAALAGVGVAGIAIGFAAKETLANIVSGFSIFIDHLYKKGDWVTIADKYGQVKDITLRTTKIRTLDNIFVIVPNAQVTQNPVTNYSEEGMVRITVIVGIAYNAAIDQAREVLIAAAAAISGVRTEPAPTVVVDELSDSSVNLKVRMWVDDAGTDPSFRFALTEACKKALDKANIEIPFPQRVIHQSKPE